MQALIDFLPVIAFVVTYWFSGDMSLAIMVIMGAVALQLMATWVIKREISKMLLASAVLVVVLGGISLALDNPVFSSGNPQASTGSLPSSFWAATGLATNRWYNACSPQYPRTR